MYTDCKDWQQSHRIQYSRADGRVLEPPQAKDQPVLLSRKFDSHTFHLVCEFSFLFEDSPVRAFLLVPLLHRAMLLWVLS